MDVRLPSTPSTLTAVPLAVFSRLMAPDDRCRRQTGSKFGEWRAFGIYYDNYPKAGTGIWRSLELNYKCWIPSIGGVGGFACQGLFFRLVVSTYTAHPDIPIAHRGPVIL